MNKLVGYLIGAIVLFLVVTAILPLRWTMIQPGHVGVEVQKGTFGGKTGVNPEPLNVGMHYYNHWTTEIISYKVSARSFPETSMSNENEKEYSMELKTNDGQNINIDLTIIFSLNAKDVPALHQTIGQNYIDQILLPQVRSEARIAIGNYSAEEIYQGKVRDQIQLRIKEKLATVLSKYPAINIQDALLRHFQFSQKFEAAIEAKKLAAQEVEVNKNRALAQEQEALRIEAQARGEKLKVVQEAQGRAESKKIEADATQYQLEAEAKGNLAKYQAEAEGKRLAADALGGGQNVVALEFASKIAPTLQVWGVPTGQNSTSLMDLNGLFGKMIPKAEK